MSIKVHIVNSVEPIVHHGGDQKAICGAIVEKALPATIIPDVALASVGIIADTFGPSMCGYCQLDESQLVNGWVYFMVSREDARKLRRAAELSEVG